MSVAGPYAILKYFTGNVITVKLMLLANRLCVKHSSYGTSSCSKFVAESRSRTWYYWLM